MKITKSNVRQFLITYRTKHELWNAHLNNYISTDSETQLKCADDYLTEMKQIEDAISDGLSEA